MALARVKVWVAGEILTAADLNAEFNNILNNPTALISPFTANLNANGKQITNLALENLGASPSAGTAGRIWFNTATTVKQAEVDDGAFIRTVPTVLATSLTPGDILYAVAGSSQGGNPSWTRLGNAASSQTAIPLISATSGPLWETRMHTKWVTFNGVVTSSQITAMDAYGVSTAVNAIVRVAAGTYTIPWASNWPSTSYAITGITQSTNASMISVQVTSSSGIESSQVTIFTKNTGTGAATDVPYVSVIAVGRV